jgi:hypothetical protein
MLPNVLPERSRGEHLGHVGPLTPPGTRAILPAMDAAGTPHRTAGGRAALAVGVLAALAALVLIAGIAMALLGPASGGAPRARPLITQDGAAAIAREFYAGAHGDGAKVADVTIKNEVAVTSTGGRPIWRVEIVGGVMEKGSTTITYESAMWLAIDAETGAVTIEAQG